MPEQVDRYAEIQEQLLEDLKNTGFRAGVEDEVVQPTIPRRLRGVPDDKLRDLCDDLLHFYDFLTNEIVRVLPYKDTSKAKFAELKAKKLLELKGKAGFGSADYRRAALEADPELADLNADYQYFRTRHDMQEERRKMISKSIDRVQRELYQRGIGMAQSPESPRGAPRSAPHTGHNKFSAQNWKKRHVRS